MMRSRSKERERERNYKHNSFDRSDQSFEGSGSSGKSEKMEIDHFISHVSTLRSIVRDSPFVFLIFSSRGTRKKVANDPQ